MIYKQCTLRKKTTKGYKEQTSWIPTPFCDCKVLKLKDDNDMWEDGWEVVLVGESKDDKEDWCWTVICDCWGH